MRPVSIDFYNNYMTNFHDNPFETDGGMHNVRVLRNMMINSASHAFCNQPAIGGPVYWIRNIAYHLPGGSTRLTSGSAGVLFYHNTILSETAAAGHRQHALAEQPVSRRELARRRSSASTPSPTTPSSDYNGFRPNPGAEFSFQWNSPADGVRGRLHRRRDQRADARHACSSRRSPSTARRPDRIGTACSSTTTSSSTCRGSTRRTSGTVQKVYKAEDFDFRLKPASAAVDRGRARCPTSTTASRAGAGSGRARGGAAAAALRAASRDRRLTSETTFNAENTKKPETSQFLCVLCVLLR